MSDAVKSLEMAGRRWNGPGPAQGGLVPMQEIPYGYCQCGCGQRTTVATRNHYNRGVLKGQPQRFVSGHGRKNAKVREAVAAGAKTCVGCGEVKLLSEFPASKYTTDRRVSRCRECTRAQSREYYRKRVADPAKRAEIFGQISARRRLEPEKRRARDVIRNDLARGKLVRPSECEECGLEARLDAHHDDYSKPREVRWLCRICHATLHHGEAA